VIFLAFAFLVYGFVFSNGLCCGDDSTNAVVAKNLAFGKGYLNTILSSGASGSKYFDPEISTGPTLNVPAAGLIYVVGNVPWAPGFITATLTVILLLATAIFVSKWAGVLRAAAYLALLRPFAPGGARQIRRGDQVSRDASIRNLLRTAALLEHLGNERPFVMSWFATNSGWTSIRFRSSLNGNIHAAKCCWTRRRSSSRAALPIQRSH
jgi:hypothetical protein